MTLGVDEGAALGALAGDFGAMSRGTLAARLHGAGMSSARAAAAIESLERKKLIRESAGGLGATEAGLAAFLAFYGELERALDPSPIIDTQSECRSIPWLTSVKTSWIEAVSINYAVDPDALRRLLPKPLEPELHKGVAWVQVLMSSLRDMRPRGTLSLFGVCFYQISYRAAVRVTARDGSVRRGSYFIRSDTNHELMRSVGNALREFKFHRFGRAKMVMARERSKLVLGVDCEPGHEGGRLVGVLDLETAQPPAGSRWASLEELQEPLVDCFDAFGVDSDAGWLYTLTIDRGPWNARFIRHETLYCEYFDTGPIAHAATLDSVLYVPSCDYSWRPLRRERLP